MSGQGRRVRGGCQTVKAQPHRVDGRLFTIWLADPPLCHRRHCWGTPRGLSSHTRKLFANTLQQRHILLCVMPTNPSDFRQIRVQVHVSSSPIKFSRPDTLCHRSELPEIHMAERKSAVFIRARQNSCPTHTVRARVKLHGCFQLLFVLSKKVEDRARLSKLPHHVTLFVSPNSI